MKVNTYDEALKLMFEYRGIRFELLSDELKAEAIQKLNSNGQLYCQAALLLRRGPEKPYLERVKANTDNKVKWICKNANCYHDCVVDAIDSQNMKPKTCLLRNDVDIEWQVKGESDE